MLTPTFYANYSALPTPWCERLALAGFGASMRLAGTRLVVEGLEQVPGRPVLFATNSTQKHDYMAFRWIADAAGMPCVTVTKAKNYHDRAMGLLLARLGVVPLASRGYLLLVDFTAVHRRRPTEAEYRALRDYLDHGTRLPDGDVFAALTRPRALLGHAADADADADREAYRRRIGRVYAASLGETLRLTRTAVAAGYHVQMYPEGTVSPTLGRGRIGAVQLAWALGLPIVPVGMSGCPDGFAGDSPFLRRGGSPITIRFGAPIALPSAMLPPGFRPFDPDHEAAHRDSLTGFTDGTLMPAIDALLDLPFRHRADAPTGGKGIRAHL